VQTRKFLIRLLVGSGLCGFLLVACTGRGINTAPVFTPISGTTTLSADLTNTSQTVEGVKFLVDNVEVGMDTQGPDWSIDYDTRQIDNGVHFVKAIANPGGNEVVLLDVAILVNNPILTPESPPATP